MSLAYLQSFGARRAMAALITGIANSMRADACFCPVWGAYRDGECCRSQRRRAVHFYGYTGTDRRRKCDRHYRDRECRYRPRGSAAWRSCQRSAGGATGRHGPSQRLALLEAQQVESTLRRDEANTAIAGDRDILALLEEQLALLSGRAERAQTLVSRNALAADAAETAQTAVINARQQIAQRRATLASRDSQLRLAEAAMARLAIEIKQIKADIAATRITAPQDGQIVFLVPATRGYSREGDVLVRTRAQSDYEVEAEIPLDYLRFVARSKSIDATNYAGRKLTLTPRVFLPVQNIRTGTQTIRFAVEGDLPRSLRAENAPVTLKVPTTSPAPVVTVPKDAVIPVSGGHVVFVAEEGIAVQKRVRLGNAVDGSFVVLSGIKAGEQVITRGNEGLVDGRKIKIDDPGNALKDQRASNGR